MSKAIMRLASANIHNYKSNQRVYGKGHWRYGDRPEDLSHVSLDFRIVLERHCAMVRDYNGAPRLADGAAEFLMDLLTVANLLGFIRREIYVPVRWSPDAE